MNSIVRKVVVASAVALACISSPLSAGFAQQTAKTQVIKTRTDHFSGTQWVLVISYLPAEITSITCDTWTMLGVGSWKNQNNFTIPSGPAVAVMDANGFNGYCKTAGSIVAHTDDGDYPGVLDRGAGNWNASTKLTFSGK